MNIFAMDEEEICQALSLPVSDEDSNENIDNETDQCPSVEDFKDDNITEDLSYLSPELLSAFKIVDSLANANHKSVNLPFMNPVEENGKSHRNYYQVTKKPLWLKKIHSDILAGNYNTIREVVSDLRLLLENCYRYYGQNHPYIKKGLKLETILEQKLALLPSNLREETMLEVTTPELARMYLELKEQSQQQGASQAGLTGARATSAIFQCVREEKAQKDKDRKRELTEMRRAEREAAHQETLHWEEALLADHASDIRKMWELPQIGHFLYLAQKTLNLPEVSQYELERSIFMPAGSSLMATIMTSLLSTPHQRAKLDQWPAMLYKTWESRLKMRIQHWYKVYISKERNLLKVFELIGIEPEFFRIMGDVHPLENKTFQELTLKQRVWVLKSLCDYCLHNHKTVQDTIMEVGYEDQHESLLGEDREGNLYVHFPQFCGQSLRIYRMTKETDVPELDLSLPPPVVQSDASGKVDGMENDGKVKDEDGTENASSIKAPAPQKKRGRKRKQKRVEDKPVKPQPPTFELVVESVESLRNLMDCFVEAEPRNTRRQSTRGRRGKESGGQPYCEKLLHRRLKNLLVELEPWEQKLEQAIIKTRLKLKKEWEDGKMKDAKNEEEVDNFWGLETEDEVPQVNLESSSSSASEYEEDPNASEFRLTHQRTCTRRKRVWESESSSSESESEPFKITVSSRGRVCKMRNFNFVPGSEKPATATVAQPAVATVKKTVKTTSKPTTVTLNGMQPKQRDMLESHRSKNSATDAQIQYQWETMRLKLLKDKEAETATSLKTEPEDRNRELARTSILSKVVKPSQNENTLDTDVFLKAGPDFGSWKSSTPGSAFTEQTFSTLLDRSSYQSLPPVKARPPPPKKLEIVKLTVPATAQASKLDNFQLPNYMEKPKLGIFRDKNIAGNERQVKTTFAAPGILRTTISKRPTPVNPVKSVVQSSPTKPSTPVKPVTTFAATTQTAKTDLIPTIGRPGQKILVLPIKDAAGNKVLLQVVPKGSQPLKLSQFKGITSVVNKKEIESKIVLSNNNNNRFTTTLSVRKELCNQNVRVLSAQTNQVLSNQNQEVGNNRDQTVVISQNQHPNVLNQNDQLMTNDSRQVMMTNDSRQVMMTNNNQQVLMTNDNQQVLMTNDNQQVLMTNDNQQVMSNHDLSNNTQAFLNSNPGQPIQDPLYQAVTSQILQSPVSQEIQDNIVLHNTSISQTQPMLQTTVSQEIAANQILQGSISQELTMSQDVIANQILQAPITQEIASNSILHSPPHEHYTSNQNMSPPATQILTSPTNHSQLIHTIQSANSTQIFNSTLATQNQVLQTTPNQILTSVSPVYTNPDGSVTLLTQSSTGTVVLPVQTHIYAPPIYASSEPKVIVCANGQVLDGNIPQENLFVVTSGGQLVSMDNCTFQQTVLAEQISPL